MTSLRFLFLPILVFLCPTILPLAEEPVIEDAIAITTTPAHRMNENNKRRGPWWKDRHEEKRALAQQGDWELVFIGDSITHGWERNGKTAWDQYYGDRKALNLGFGGDRTEHVLWRLDHGEFDGYKPLVAVIMIGTNNTGHDMHPPEAIAAGNEAWDDGGRLGNDERWKGRVKSCRLTPAMRENDAMQHRLRWQYGESETGP